MLARFERRYRAEVEEVALRLLAVPSSSRLARPKRWLLEPLAFTLERRRSFFRAGFTLTAAESAGQREAGPFLAAAIEIGWTCALVLDDVFDVADEREGHPAAHRVFGLGRAFAAVAAAQLVLLATLLFRTPQPLGTRLRVTWSGIGVVLRGFRSQLPSRQRPPPLERYAQRGWEANMTSVWTMTAPLVGRVDRGTLRAVRSCARLMCANGKFRNDLLDYCGGSSENDSVLVDFEGRRITLPAIVALEQADDPADRRRLEEHFRVRRGRAMTATDGVAVMARHDTIARCVELIRANARRAADDAAVIGRDWPSGSALTSLMHDWALAWAEAAAERAGAPSAG
jgi:geranylgeranyl pyrophosphate synthase